MALNYTTNLALAQPVTGTESLNWGDDVNNGITAYLDIAIAGGLAVTITTADVTLTNTQGSYVGTNIGSTTAQYAILNISGAMTAARNLIVPSSSKSYIVNNACTGGYLLTVKGSATTGVTLTNGEKAVVAWNGTDYVKITSSVASAAGSNTQVQFNNSGVFGGSASFTWDGTSVSATNYIGTGAITASTTKGVYSYGTLGYSDVNHILTMASSQNNYIQMEIQNTNAGAAASSDVVVANNNTTASTYYGNFGMNSSGWTGTLGTNSFNAPNVVYLTSTTGDLLLGTTTANAIRLAVNGGADAMKVDGTTSIVSFPTTGAITLPVGTTGQQPTAAAGMLRFNSTTTQFEGYNGSAWSSVGGAAISNDTATATNVYPLFASATSGTALTVYTSNAKYLYKPSTGELQASEMVATNGIFVNATTISASYTVAAGNNAHSIGPVTIASGQSVTVTSGQRWLVF
jgi:hypothetical protein